jgi:hypothetical protein
MASPIKAKRAKKANKVICITRRSDAAATPEVLAKIVEAFKAGSITYDHPKFARNKNPQQCTVSLKHEDGVEVIDWWTQDATHLIEELRRDAELWNQYKVHFKFPINGEAHSLMQPGLSASLDDRIDRQLPELVAICRDQFHQDPDKSIVVGIEPIYIWNYVGDPVRHISLKHFRRLCEQMKSLGLTRLHISFVQFSWISTNSRVKKLADSGFEIGNTDSEYQAHIFEKYMLPHTTANGIQVQTCTAMNLVERYSESGLVIHGACSGGADIASITGDPEAASLVRKPDGKSTRNCLCYPFKDIGSQHFPCKHGCRVCFMNPANFPIPDIEDSVKQSTHLDADKEDEMLI